MSRVAGKLLVVAFVFGLTGCGGGDNPDRPALYPVKGKVTLNGEILAGASVTFYPKSGPTARGVTDDKGEYTLTTYEAGDGAVEGSHQITVHKTEGGEAAADVAPLDPDSDAEPAAVAGAPGDDPGAETELEESKSLVPKEFTTLLETTLSAVVKTDGPNDVPLDLTGTVN